MLKNNLGFCAVIISLLYSTTSHGHGDDGLFGLSLQELSELSVVIAASGFEQKIIDAPATVHVIQRSQWQASGARHIADVLRTVPGIHVTESQINYKHAVFTVRGLTGSFGQQVKILIDGEEFSSAQDGGILNGFDLPLGLFSRVEVVKSPGSAVYGADAFAGVINLITEDPDTDNASLQIRLGNFGTRDIGALNHFDLGGGAKAVAGFEYSRSDDDPGRIVNADLQTTLDGAFGTNASNAPGRIDEHYEVFSGFIKLQTDAFDLKVLTYRNFDVGLGAGIAQALDTDGDSSNRFDLYSVGLKLGQWLAGENLRLSFSYRDSETSNFLKIFPDNAVVPIGSDGNIDFVQPTTFALFPDGVIGAPGHIANRANTRLTWLKTIAGQHQLRVETGYEKMRFRAYERKNFGPGILDGSETVVDGNWVNVSDTEYVFLPKIERTVRYLAVQDYWTLSDHWSVSLGVRHDDYSDFGSTTNPRLALHWRASERLSLKLFSGSAFRAPNVADLYSQNNPTGLGNRELSPEDIDTHEFGLNASFSVHRDLQLELSTFDYKAENLIEFVFDPAAQLRIAENIGTQNGRGAEFAIRWKPVPDWILNAHLSWLDAEDQHGAKVADVPEWKGFVSANYRINDRWSWYFDAIRIAGRERAAGDVRDAIADYTLSNTRIAYRWSEHLSIGLNAYNAFDSDAREPSNGSIPDDYPQPGRSVYLDFNYDFD